LAKEIGIMITITYHDHGIEATVYGEFTLADFQEIEAAVDYANRFHGPVRLLLDLRPMLTYTLDVAWEELRYTRAYPEQFERIAIVTQDEWLTWIAWLERLFVEAEVATFPDEAAARAWLAEVNEIDRGEPHEQTS